MAKSKDDSSTVKEGEDIVNYEGVDQGQEEQPALQETATAEAKVKKGKKGKKGRAVSSSVPTEFKTRRDELRCGFCGNPMTMSKEIHVVQVTGKKIPKGADGEPLYQSFGTSKSGLVGVLCDDCTKAGETTAVREDGTSGVDVKFAIACRNDGSIRMVPIGELPDA